MLCPNCQIPVPDDAKFCDNCGSPISAPTQPMQQPQQSSYEQQPYQPTQQTYQQPPQQPAYGQPYPAYPQQPAKSSGGKIALIVIIVIAVLVVGGLIVRPIISDMLNPNEPGKEQPDPEIRTNTNTTNTANTNTENNAIEENVNTNEANETVVVPAEPAKPQVISRYSTSAMAEVGDTYWMTDPMIAYGTMPEGVEKLDLDQVAGGWKFIIISREAGSYEYFANCLIEKPSDTAVITVTWDKVRMDGETRDAGTPPSVFEGSLTGEMVGSGLITLDGFWERDEHQYGIGTFMWPDGEKATVAMVRP